MTVEAFQVIFIVCLIWKLILWKNFYTVSTDFIQFFSTNFLESQNKYRPIGKQFVLLKKGNFICLLLFSTKWLQRDRTHDLGLSVFIPLYTFLLCTKFIGKFLANKRIKLISWEVCPSIQAMVLNRVKILIGLMKLW